MTAKRVYFGMIGFIAFLSIAILACAYFGSKLIADQGQKLADLKSQSSAVELQQTSLVQAKKDIETYNEIDAIAKAVVPQDKDQARTVREINKIASETGISLKTIAFQTSNLGQAPTAAPKPAEGAAPAGDAPAAAPATPAQPAAPTQSQVTPVEGIQGVLSLPITISTPENSPVSYRNFLLFLQRLESNRRTAHVDQIAITPTASGSSLTFTLTLNAYLRQ